MMAGDNPIYALSSDVIAISVPPNNSHRGKNTDYVNVFQAQQKLESAPDSKTDKQESVSDQSPTPACHQAKTGSSHYENIQLHTDSDIAITPGDKSGCGGRDYQNVVL